MFSNPSCLSPYDMLLISHTEESTLIKAAGLSSYLSSFRYGFYDAPHYLSIVARHDYMMSTSRLMLLSDSPDKHSALRTLLAHSPNWVASLQDFLDGRLVL